MVLCSAIIPHNEIILRSWCRNGELENAINVLTQTSAALSSSTYISLLKLCICRKALCHARRVHAHLIQHHVDVVGFLADYLVMSLAKCGGIEEASRLFAAQPLHTVFSWTALISAAVSSDCCNEALEMYLQMLDEGVEPSEYTFVSLFKACAISQDLDQGRHLHADACKRGYVRDVFVGSALISMYGKCREVSEAENVFMTLIFPDTVLWNALLSVYVEQGHEDRVLLLYRQMHAEFVKTDQLTLIFVLQACCALMEKANDLHEEAQTTKAIVLDIGEAIHSDSKRMDPNIFLSNTLVMFYGKCGMVPDAENVFGALVQRSTVSWNSMISAYIEFRDGEKALLMYRQMQSEGAHPDQRTLLFALQACKLLIEGEDFHVENSVLGFIPLEIGRALHADACTRDFEINIFTSTALLSLYGKSGALREAENVFMELPQHDEVVWNAMMSSYIEHGHGQKALALFRQMCAERPMPGQIGNMLALQACSILGEDVNSDIDQGFLKRMSIEIGQALHADVHKRGVTSEFHFASALLAFYVKFGELHKAENVFSMLRQRDAVLWTVMLAAYVERDEAEIVLQLYVQMQREGVNSDEHSLVCALQACSIFVEKDQDLANLRQPSRQMIALEIGKALHVEACRSSVISNVFVGNALISMYGKCKALMAGEDTFIAMAVSNVVSWNAMLLLYIENEEEEKALWVYFQMKQQDVAVNDTTFACILTACRSIENCKLIHFDTVSTGYEQVLSVAASMIHAYGNCASMVDGQEVFDELRSVDIVLWNACIDGYAGEGGFIAGQHAFNSCLFVGVTPDDVTFTSILNICSHTAHVLEGLKYFESMTRDYGLYPNVKHYSILLDLLGRVGDFGRISNILSFKHMQMNLAMWLCLLGACSAHGNVELAKYAFHRAVQLQPKQPTAYVVMANIFTDPRLKDFDFII